jgi:hypothetical protein
MINSKNRSAKNRSVKNRLAGTAVMFAAVSLASVALTSEASAQCVDCSEYQNRDPFTQGLSPTPATPPTGETAPRAPNDSHAEMRGHHERHVANQEHRHH